MYCQNHKQEAKLSLG